MRIESLEDSEDVILSSFRLLPELIKVISGHKTHIVFGQKINQFPGGIFRLTPFRNRKMDMGACNNQGLLIFSLLSQTLKPDGALDGLSLPPFRSSESLLQRPSAYLEF